MVSDSSVSAETVIYEAFVCIGKYGGVSLHSFSGGKEKCREARNEKNGLVSMFFLFLHASNAEKPHLSSPITTKGS